MKTSKLIIGIISIVLTLIILLQSCAATVGDALANEGGTSGGAGMLVAVLMLIAGIVAITTRNSRGGGIFCVVAYALAGVVGITMHGIYTDLQIWGGLCIIFAIIFFIFTIKFKKNTSDVKHEE